MKFTPVVFQRIVLLVAVLGAFLPWATLGDIRITGTSTTQGTMVLIATGLGLLLTFGAPVDPKARTFEFVLIAVAVLAPVYFYLRNFGGDGQLSGASPGYGLFMCIPPSFAWLCWFLWESRGSSRYRRPRPPRRLDDWG